MLDVDFPVDSFRRKFWMPSSYAATAQPALPGELKIVYNMLRLGAGGFGMS